MANMVPTFCQGAGMVAHRPPESRPGAAVRGYDRRWRRIRERLLDAAPLCASCEARGDVVPAALVHHVRPIAEGGSHDLANLQPLCGPCHARAHAKGGR